MKLNFFKIELPAKNADHIDVRFQIEGDEENQSFFCGALQVSMPVSEAMEMKLSDIVSRAHDNLTQHLKVGTK